MNPAKSSATYDAPVRASAAAAIDKAAERLRGAARCDPLRVAAALADNAERWRDRAFAARRATVAAIAEASGMAPALLDESLDALLAPLTRVALNARAAALAPPNGYGRSCAPASRLLGFLMAGNVAGAGIHELCAALLAGARAIVKPASSEPLFFANFLRTMAEADAAAGALAEVVNFGRADRAALGALWAQCDGGVVAYGDDASIAALGAGRARRPFAGFASRLSGALVTADALAAPAAAEEAAESALARDVTLFEQRGCLSPHHVFVAGAAAQRDAGQARGFAARLAGALEALARRLPPARAPLEAAAAIRALRERARWRALALRAAHGGDVALWEGGDLGWTVIYDRDASFCPSPGYRTVVVSWLDDAAELQARLGGAAGRLEALALAAATAERGALERLLRALGASYVCEPGRMQSPPLDWPHGGGAFDVLLRNALR